jgi:hypothetical protein
MSGAVLGGIGGFLTAPGAVLFSRHGCYIVREEMPPPPPSLHPPSLKKEGGQQAAHTHRQQGEGRKTENKPPQEINLYESVCTKKLMKIKAGWKILEETRSRRKTETGRRKVCTFVRPHTALIQILSESWIWDVLCSFLLSS